MHAVDKNRFKKPVPYTKDDGVYEAFHFAKGSLQPETKDDLGALAMLGENISADKVFYILSSCDATKYKKNIVRGGRFS